MKVLCAGFCAGVAADSRTADERRNIACVQIILSIYYIPHRRRSATVTTTLYLGGFNYINDVLQFTAHEEGRIRPKTVGNTANCFVYDYFIKDHLGNVRMVLTDDTETAFYPAATMETATATNEELYYSNLPQTRTTTLPSSYPANTPGRQCKSGKGERRSRQLQSRPGNYLKSNGR